MSVDISLSYSHIPSLLPDWFYAIHLKKSVGGENFSAEGLDGDAHSKRIVTSCVNMTLQCISNQDKRCMVDIYGPGVVDSLGNVGYRDEQGCQHNDTPEHMAELEDLAYAIVAELCIVRAFDATLVGYDNTAYFGADGKARPYKHIEIWNPMKRHRDSNW